MKQKQQIPPVNSAYNKEVMRVYFKLLQATKRLLATIENPQLRVVQQREDRSPLGFNTNVHEFINPLIYLNLKYSGYDKLHIQFGFEQENTENEQLNVTARFVRLLFNYTSQDQTNVNIEDCIDLDTVISTCSEYYEVVENSNKGFSFYQIPFKNTGVKRKLMSVA